MLLKVCEWSLSEMRKNGLLESCDNFQSALLLVIRGRERYLYYTGKKV